MDIKPANMEELTEVITSAEFHPQQCHTFAYSSSKGSIRLCDMRQAALCDKHCKCEYQCATGTNLCHGFQGGPPANFAGHKKQQISTIDAVIASRLTVVNNGNIA